VKENGQEIIMECSNILDTPYTSYISTNNENKTNEIIKLLSCLNYSRYGYNDWLNIGIIIFNEINNINIWKQWSKDYKKYDENELNNKWKTFKNPWDCRKILTIATLHTYAKEDNLEKYNKIIKEKNIEIKHNQIVSHDSRNQIVSHDSRNQIVSHDSSEINNKELILSNSLSKPQLYIKLFDECYKQERFDLSHYNTAIGMAIRNIFWWQWRRSTIIWLL